MANVAGYNALQGSVGVIWAAAIVAMADFVIAAIVLVVAGRSQPGSEIDVALEVRRMALESIHEDARDLATRSPNSPLGKLADALRPTGSSTVRIF